ncbi:MAG TPA: prepilin-type N-terminal cleavage/methylation domain-containing protein [Thermoanaerobaculia bacterium]|jgi:prepilin-type N-terminal cleavage/methylation domain-containing protein|nr:prepilin-type N-terminal cleavage/methylation domain-containing protein [Thermoanaerobaculia bacterium]
MKIRNRQKGFTLIELLIVVAIIGIIAALLIPNFLDALQKAKQKRTVADARNTGTAMFSWLTDQLGAAAAGAGTTSTVAMSDYEDGATDAGSLTSILVPQYLQSVPAKDGWKHDYEYWLKTGTQVLEKQVMAIRSSGRDTDTDDTYTVGPFEPTDYDQDIVWADGFFVRWPEKPGTGTTGGS